MQLGGAHLENTRLTRTGLHREQGPFIVVGGNLTYVIVGPDGRI
jgi:hypothetical protein